LLRTGKFAPIRQHDFHNLLGHLADFRKHRSPVTPMHTLCLPPIRPACIMSAL
jgi:hypothetical protein